jgi:predicted  nucleic acid-binding Zn-ribbon protein
MCPICLAAENERLRAERDDLMKANALLHALVGNREAEIERAYDQLHNERDDAQAEIERLRADKDVIRSQERNATYERDIAALEAEIDKLGRSYERDIAALETENERLRAAFKGAS